ncbi:MAG: hypothetical protein Q4B94_04595 [Pseudomonadota bacterium]|nr:hypothetical protein [Pseudomonadota bacterium]
MKAINVTVRMRDGSRITYGCIAPTTFAACMAAYRRFWGQVASAKAKPIHPQHRPA